MLGTLGLNAMYANITNSGTDIRGFNNTPVYTNHFSLSLSLSLFFFFFFWPQPEHAELPGPGVEHVSQ